MPGVHLDVIFGWTAPSSWIGSIEPVWVIVLSPLFAIMWTRLGNRAPTIPRKFAYGVIGMALAFLLFLPMGGTTGRAVPALLVVGIMAVFAVSELLLSPIGLSVTTKLAPEAFRAQMMALYFFSVGLGTSMSGALARYYDPAQEFAYFRHHRCGGYRRRRRGIRARAVGELSHGGRPLTALTIQPARISCSTGGSMFPPVTMSTVRPGGDPRR
jgi:dipeptide/tripeptide permease